MFVFLIFFMIQSNTRAARNDITDDYIKSVVKEIASDPNVGGWCWEVNGNGGYIKRFAIDLNNNKGKLIFLSSTLLSEKYISNWTVFEVSGDNEVRKYTAPLNLQSPKILRSDDQISLIEVGPPNREKQKAGDAESIPFRQFTFTYPKWNQTKIYVSEVKAADLEKDGTTPLIESILLADYLMESSPEWTTGGEWQIDATDSSFKKGDRERAMRNTAFTPQVALAKLDGTQPESAPPSPKASPLPAPLPDPLDGPKTGQKAFEGSLGSSAVKTVLAVVILIASLGLLRWLIKRRS